MRKIFKLAFIVSILFSFSYAYFSTGFGAGYLFGSKPKKGFWTEHIVIGSDGSKTSMKTVFAGETSYNGKRVFAIENSIEVNNNKMASMTLFDKKTYSILKVATQTPMGLMCQDLENTPSSMPQTGSSTADNKNIKNPKEIKRKYPKIKKATYTTPSGKKVNCTVYKTEEGEAWLNNKIGIVKVVERGKVVMYLKDFGDNGSPTISISEAISCQPMAMPMIPMEPMGGLPQ